ncbi:MAG TPA: UDP-N-acetylmuramoyl-tripeptide--D-alanyl-D-alanine ligase, partial [Myxococcales bacterium]
QFVAQAIRGGAAAAVVQRGQGLPAMPDSEFALFEVEDTLRALGGLARFHRCRFQLPVGAITGSNGKTTTKEMVHSILATRGPALKTEGNLNNEVGVPLTLFRLSPTDIAAVVELGMNRPGEIARLTAIAQPDAGLITAVHPAHLEGLGTLEGVANAKGELFRGLKAGAVAVVNVDDPLIVSQAEHSDVQMLSFGQHQRADVQLREVKLQPPDHLTCLIRYASREYPVRLAFVGEHNARNAAAAFAMASALGYQPQECVRGLEAARPYPGRLRILIAPGGVTVLDDSYNANPASMQAALETLGALAAGGRPVAVLGDMLELGAQEAREHRALGERSSRTAEVAAFFGPRSAEAYRAASRLGERAAHFLDLESLVAWLKPKLRAGDVVLVKASRGMRLERAVGALVGDPAAGEGH